MNIKINSQFPSTDFLQGGGEMGDRIRNFDWSATPLGVPENWPQSLKTCVRIMLASRQPMWIGWGKDLIKLYNDPYKDIVGGKHPWALAKPASVVWKDIWSEISPLLNRVLEFDEGTYVESQLLIMERNGYPEETYYTFSYTPIPGDDGKTAGMICANSDDTDRIISERQLKTLTSLGSLLSEAKTEKDVISKAIYSLGENKRDFPFVVLYSLKDNCWERDISRNLNLSSDIPLTIDLSDNTHYWSSIFNVALKDKICKVSLEGVSDLPNGVWDVATTKGVVLPVFSISHEEVYCFIFIGCNPYTLYDDKYTRFLSLITDKIAKSFADVRALEQERKRSQALAELDKAKTIFFSNISHEFRTPLALLLGPIEETLKNPGQIEDTISRMDIAYRNARRLQKLVNSLLDFARIEAGKMKGTFTMVDILKLTSELASLFRSAIENAGMDLKISCASIKSDIYVDIEMWEKIVVNLLSNAFKYSSKGYVEIKIYEEGKRLILNVIDTGIGIPSSELEKVFDRFYRIEGDGARSKEGTGIGLAMVKELVKIHGGEISVTSNVGQGSNFEVSIPTGKAHLPPEHVSTEVTEFNLNWASPVLSDLLNWRRPSNQNELSSNIPDNSGFNPSVMIVDDNDDMRAYTEKLLTNNYRVVKAANGEEAFKLILQHKPDLLLSDVMMPKVDGFQLLKLIRNHPETKSLPVILLSARAGEEAKIEGLKAGADDYLVKPFAAKELIARIDANIKIAKNRQASELNIRRVIAQSPVAMTMLKGENLLIEIANDRAIELWGKEREKVINRPALEAFSELKSQGFGEILEGVYKTGKIFTANEMPVTILRHGILETLYINFIYAPLHDENSNIEGIIGVGVDVTTQVIARDKIKLAEEKSLLAIQSAELGTYELDLLTNELITSERFKEIWGITINKRPEELKESLHPDDLSLRNKAHEDARQTGNLHYEARIIWADGSLHWVRVKGKVIFDTKHNPISLTGIVQDITAQKLFTEQLKGLVLQRTAELERSNTDLQQFAHVASHDLKEPVRKIKTFASRIEDEYGDNLPEQGRLFMLKILHATDRITAMIDGVLNYSSINNEDILTEVSLNKIFEQVLSDLELIIEEKNATIKIAEMGTIHASPVLIYQLFYNIISNSLKFSKEDISPIITIGSENGKKHVRVTIKDNGIGFDQQYAEQIFNTFTRLNSKDKYEGTGLGLALCKKIAEKSGGSIKAKSFKNEGATFIISLPLYSTKNV